MAPIDPAGWASDEARALAEDWRARVEQRDAQIEVIRRATGENYWNNRADDFARRVRAAAMPDATFDYISRFVHEGTDVLDVGAGVGRYATPLARVARRVTAIEPSEGMRAHLRESIAGAGIENIAIVPGAWEDVDVPSADLVLCSHVLYGVRDILPFLRRLHEHARQRVVIAIRVDQFDEYIRPLWRQLYAEERRREPGLKELYPLLLALGVVAEVNLVPYTGNRVFTDREAASAWVRSQVYVPANAEQPEIERYLAERLVESEDGWSWRHRPLHAALVSWATDAGGAP